MEASWVAAEMRASGVVAHSPIAIQTMEAGEHDSKASEPGWSIRPRRDEAMLRIKRTYDPPAHGDGRRILVERLWPRGVRKESLELDDWIKGVAPSTRLRQWFGHRVERWDEFCARYRKELDANPAAWLPILDAGRRGPVTLLYSARDVLHNGAVVLRDYVVERGASALDRGDQVRRARGASEPTRPNSV